MAIAHAMPSRELKLFLFGAGFTVLLFIIFSFLIKTVPIPFASAQSAAIQACANAMTETGRLTMSGTSSAEAMAGQNAACAGLSTTEMAQAAQLQKGATQPMPTQTMPMMPMMPTMPMMMPTQTMPMMPMMPTMPMMQMPTSTSTPAASTTTPPAATSVEPQAATTLPVEDTSADDQAALKVQELEKKLRAFEAKQKQDALLEKLKQLQKLSAPEPQEEILVPEEEPIAPEPPRKIQKSPLEKALDIVEDRIDTLYDLADPKDKNSKKKFTKESAATFGLITNLCKNKKLAIANKCNTKKWQKTYKKNAKNPDLVLDLLDEMVSTLKDS